MRPRRATVPTGPAEHRGPRVALSAREVRGWPGGLAEQRPVAREREGAPPAARVVARQEGPAERAPAEKRAPVVRALAVRAVRERAGRHPSTSRTRVRNPRERSAITKVAATAATRTNIGKIRG